MSVITKQQADKYLDYLTDKLQDANLEILKLNIRTTFIS